MENPVAFGATFDRNRRLARQILHTDRSTDMVERDVLIGGRESVLFFADGLVQGDVLEKIMEFLLKLTPEQLPSNMTAEQFDKQFVTYIEVTRQRELAPFALDIAMGRVGLLIDGFDEAILIEVRDYPARSVDEPQDDRVLRGPHDGFVETALFNTALMRRRIRDPRLINTVIQVGTLSHTDVFISYLDGVCDQKLVDKVMKLLQSIDVPNTTMAQESITECLVRRQWYNPFPKVRFTERPDAACAAIAEGRVVVTVDNTPAAIILPTALFDFVQDTNDYYFPPLVGSYLRFVRNVIFFTTLLLTPLWYLANQYADKLPEWLSFIRVDSPTPVPLLVQLIIVELIVDGLKLASLNTPNSMNNAFGLIGGLILGEFAVNVNLFSQQVLLCMAFVAVANFTQPNFELGYAFKLFRLVLLFLVALFGIWGLVGGGVLLVVLLVTTHTPTGHSYLYPVIPFNKDAFCRLLWRRPIHKDNS